MATRARTLRKDMTGPEVMLWSRLRGRIADQPTFRRQHPIGSFILDFYCPSARLAVEVDGATHRNESRSQRDLERDEWLDRHGVTVVRIAASAVYRDASAVAAALLALAEELRRRG
jgi:very-short-patch-repair endonuclease